MSLIFILIKINYFYKEEMVLQKRGTITFLYLLPKKF